MNEDFKGALGPTIDSPVGVSVADIAFDCILIETSLVDFESLDVVGYFIDIATGVGCRACD